jgi:hypothetical protein
MKPIQIKSLHYTSPSEKLPKHWRLTAAVIITIIALLTTIFIIK